MCEDKLAVIVDFHCFIDNDGNELVKELAVMDVTAFASRHWIFTHPVETIVSNHKHVRTNRWLTDHYHGLTWTDGDTSYEHLVPILEKYTFPFNFVFVKGLQKKRFLQKRIVHFNIINLEDFGCPKLDQLQSIHGTACLTHRLCPEICTNSRVHALREWVVSDFRIVNTFLINY